MQSLKEANQQREWNSSLVLSNKAHNGLQFLVDNCSDLQFPHLIGSHCKFCPNHNQTAQFLRQIQFCR